MKIIIGTRGSLLALRQTEWVKNKLSKQNPDLTFCVEKISTKGDKILDAPLSKIGGKGLFTKEIEVKLLNENIDLAVHSMKDIPTELPEGLVIGAVTYREDAHDVFISVVTSKGYGDDARIGNVERLSNKVTVTERRNGSRNPNRLPLFEKKDEFDIAHPPPGIRIGTSSIRRKAQLLRINNEVKVSDLRGNLNTRLKKLNDSNLDGIIVAKAGVKRLYPDGSLGFQVSEIPFDLMLPAVGQGALGIEIRRDDRRIRKIVKGIDDSVSHSEVMAERAFLRRLGGGCQVPIAANAMTVDNILRLEGEVVSLDGARSIRDTISGEGNPELLGEKLAETLLRRGVDKILREII